MKKYHIVEDKVLKSLDENNDVLGNNIYVEELTKVIQSTSETSTTETIGLFGEWGSGKSTVINAVKLKFKNDKIKLHGKRSVTFVECDAWKYSEYDFKESFLMQIAKSNHLEEEVEKKLFEEKSTTTYSMVLWRTIIIFSFIVMFIGLILKYLKLDQIITKPIETLVTAVVVIGIEVLLLSVVNLIFKQDSTTIHNHFSQFDFNTKFKQIMKDAKNYQVIVIDNLDRCSENYAVSILDFIKGFLTNDSGNYVFILPIDESRILKELNKTRNYSTNEAKEFLSKVFDYSIVMEKSRKINLYSLIQTLNDEYKFEFSNRLMSTISDYYGDTPRQIIKIINLINSKRELIETSKKSKLKQNQVDMVGKATIIREKWKPLYAIIYKNPELLLDLYKNSNDSRVSDYIKKDSICSEFILDTRHITCENPIMYLHNLSDDVIYNVNVFRQVQTCTFSDDLILRDNIKPSHIEYILDQLIQEYVIKRKNISLIEIFISANRIIDLYNNKDFIYTSVMENLLELYDILVKSYKNIDFFDETNKILLNKFAKSICNNLSSDRVLNSFEKLLEAANLLSDVDILNAFLKNCFEKVKSVNDNLFSSIITSVLIKSTSSEITYLEDDFKEVSKNITIKDIKQIVDSKNIKVIRLLIISQADKLEAFSDEIINLSEINANELARSNFTNVTDKLEKLMLMSTIFNVNNKIMSEKLVRSIDSNQNLNSLYTLISQYDPSSHGEVEKRIVDLISDLFDFSIIVKNFILDSYQKNYINLITDSSYISRYKSLLYRLLDRVQMNQFKERLLITSILTTKFQDEILIEQLMDYYNKVEGSLVFLEETINNNQISSALSFHNITLNTTSIIEKVIEKLSFLKNDRFTGLINKIKFSVLAQNAKLQALVNRDKDYKKVIISNITSFNDYQIARRVLENNSVITAFEDKLTDIIKSTNNISLIGEIHDDKDNVVMKRRIQNALHDKVIEITGTFDNERYNRIDDK
ncbi:MAG: hypothetical protein JEZ05_03100 [Tenericutes bacterium]|nr:hypothetical protein [Mycoplasmatota bacterium]